MSAVDFGLGDLPLFHDACCSADENVKSVPRVASKFVTLTLPQPWAKRCSPMGHRKRIRLVIQPANGLGSFNSTHESTSRAVFLNHFGPFVLEF